MWSRLPIPLLSIQIRVLRPLMALPCNARCMISCCLQPAPTGYGFLPICGGTMAIGGVFSFHDSRTPHIFLSYGSVCQALSRVSLSSNAIGPLYRYCHPDHRTLKPHMEPPWHRLEYDYDMHERIRFYLPENKAGTSVFVEQASES